jgi:hypothetical protein
MLALSVKFTVTVRISPIWCARFGERQHRPYRVVFQGQPAGTRAARAPVEFDAMPTCRKEAHFRIPSGGVGRLPASVPWNQSADLPFVY